MSEKYEIRDLSSCKEWLKAQTGRPGQLSPSDLYATELIFNVQAVGYSINK